MINHIQTMAKRLQSTPSLPSIQPIANFGISFLDDAFGGIFPSDVVLMGARTGVGKSELMTLIAQQAAMNGKRVGFLALEADDNEIEYRTLYRIFIQTAKENPTLWAKIRGQHLSYRNFVEGKLYQHITEEEVRALAPKWFDQVYTLYRNDGGFDIQKLDQRLTELMKLSDIIILDHVHYVDIDDEKQNSELKKIIQMIRNFTLKQKKPIVVVGHLRKQQQGKYAPLVPDIEEFHGSSDLGKIATKAVILAPCYDDRIPRTDSWIFPTYFRIVKNRMDGSATRFSGVSMFDIRSSDYAKKYFLIKLNQMATNFDFVDSPPDWAKKENFMDVL